MELFGAVGASTHARNTERLIAADLLLDLLDAPLEAQDLLLEASLLTLQRGDLLLDARVVLLDAGKFASLINGKALFG